MLLKFCVACFILISSSSCNILLKKYYSLVDLTPYTSISGKSFSFKVSDKFYHIDKSRSDKNYPNMSKLEVKILNSLLKKDNYCDNDGKLIFNILSKQEKIYDVTLSGLIETQYNPKALVSVTYFGRCL
jgi:hypothetical protein